MTQAQHKLLRLMDSGATLMWFGDSGPELSRHNGWPQKSTVRALIQAGLLAWGESLNDTQRECGIVPVRLTQLGRVAAEKGAGDAP